MERVKNLKTDVKFKDTPIGKIPVNWQVNTLGEICLGQPEYGANVSSIEKDLNQLRYIRITDITDHGRLLQNTWVSIEKGYGQPYFLKDGDFLFARSGATVGKTYLYKRSDGECAFAGYLIKFRPDSDYLLPEFLFHYTHSETYLNWVKGMLRAGAQPNINATEYFGMPIPRPPLKEQKKIIEILSTLDAAIEKTDQIIEKTKELKKGLMQKLLTRGIGHTKFKKTEIGEIPAEWQLKPFIEVIVLQRGFDLPVQNRAKGNYPILASNGIIGFHNEFKAKGPSIITGRSGTLGKVHYVESDYWPLNTTLYAKEYYNNNPKFLYYFLQKLEIDKYRSGTSVPTLNRNIVHKVKVALPTLDEQNKIASFFSEADAEIQKEDAFKLQLGQLKKGLMQVLLTGKIRVNV